jgi:YD repeat-containing protein
MEMLNVRNPTMTVLSKAAWFALSIMCAGSVHAVPAIKIGTAALVNPASANASFPTAGDSTHTPSLATEQQPSPSTPNEIVELARALKSDPDLIYDYVRNNVETVWMYGLQKGAVGAIIDKSGTPFDQAHLMVELLHQANYPSATYKVGTITLNGAQFADWTGITSATAACELLASGGIPAKVNGFTDVADCATLSGSVTGVELAHVWVSVAIDAGTYVFDPSYKLYSVNAGVALASTAGLTTGQPMAQIATGMTTGTASGVSYSVNLGTTALNDTLQGYANNLRSYSQTQFPAGRIEDLIGGTSIVRYEAPTGGVRQTSLPYASTEYRSWPQAIPDQYRTSLRLEVTKGSCVDGSYPTIIDRTFFADDIYGRKMRLSGTFTVTGANSTISLTVLDEAGNGPTLYSANFKCNPGYNVGTLTLTANHPYPAAANGTTALDKDYMDAVFTSPVRYSLPLVIVHGWGDTGRGLVEKWGSRIDRTLPSLITAGCETCSSTFHASQGDGRREQLAASWLSQSATAARLHAAIAKSVYSLHHAIGVVEAEAEVKPVNFYPDQHAPVYRFTISDTFDRFDIDSAFSLTSRTADAVARNAAVHAIAATGNALEGSISAQQSDLPDTGSTATRFEWGNRPPTAEDPSGSYSGTPRRFYEFTSANAAQAAALVKVEGTATTANDGVHLGNVAEIGNVEYLRRRTALSNAITQYTAAGFDVVASEDAFLGPGQRAGGFDQANAVGFYKHRYSKQRGGALVATRYVGNDPVEIAHINVGADVNSKGGGGGAQTGHQAQYDPSQAADIIKSRFVDRSVALGVDLLNGGVSTVSPASLSVGTGGFPYELSASLIWMGGNQKSEALGPVSHTEPQTPWSTNWNNTLTVSGSGMEMMGEGDIRATGGTIAAFIAAQDVYKSAPSAQREAAGALINAWWVRQLTGNVVTVNVGSETRQFVKILTGTGSLDFLWIPTGGGPHAALAQTGQRVVYEEPSCGGGDPSYVQTRGWNYAGMSFQVTRAQGDVQTFPYWTAGFSDGGSYCAKLHGFRMSNWTFPQGVTINLVYAQSPNVGSVPELVEVNNTLGRKISFVASGRGGFSNGLAGADARSVFVSGDPAEAGTIVHTEPNGAVSKFNVAIVGEKYLLKQIYAADNSSVPSVQYEYDSLRRVKEAKDAVALQVGNRSAFQFLLADGTRGERIDPAAGRYVVLYDDRKQPFRYIDELGRVTAVTHDGRGRVTDYIYPENDKETIGYDDRNNPTLLRKTNKTGTATLEVTADWHTSWNKPNWIRDARNNQTDFVYYASGNGKSLLQTATRSADADNVRPVYTFTYNARGQVQDATDPTGLVISSTYHPTNGNLLTSTLNPSGLNAITSYDYDALGNATSITDPRSNATEHVYDLNRRKTITKHHNGNLAADVIAAEQTTYDVLGRVTKEEGGTGFSGTITWQSLKDVTYTPTGKVHTQANGAGNATVFTYDAMDRVFQVEDPILRKTRFEYDLAGQTLKEIRAYGTALQQNYATYTYTQNGQRQTVKDANNNLSTFEYDGFDRLFRLRFPLPTLGANASSLTDYEEYGYDGNGNRVSLKKRDGHTIFYDYDKLNRETRKDVFPVNASADDVYSKYDLAGRPQWKRFASISGQGIDYGYDTAKRLTTETTFGRTMTYGYDIASNRTVVQWPDPSANYIGYGFDAMNRMTEVRENSSTPGVGVLQTYAWDPLSRHSGTTPTSRANGTTTGYAYDPASRLTGLAHNLAGTSQDFGLSFEYTDASQLRVRTTSNK